MASFSWGAQLAWGTMARRVRVARHPICTTDVRASTKSLPWAVSTTSASAIGSACEIGSHWCSRGLLVIQFWGYLLGYAAANTAAYMGFLRVLCTGVYSFYKRRCCKEATAAAMLVRTETWNVSSRFQIGREKEFYIPSRVGMTINAIRYARESRREKRSFSTALRSVYKSKRAPTLVHRTVRFGTLSTNGAVNAPRRLQAGSKAAGLTHPFLCPRRLRCCPLYKPHGQGKVQASRRCTFHAAGELESPSTFKEAVCRHSKDPRRMVVRSRNH